MSLSAAQRTRLGLFLGVAGVALVGALVALFGLAALETKTEYIIRFDGSISGLAAGSPVRYNGIDVGRVARVRIDPAHLSGVEVTVSLDPDTPVRTDTRALLQFQGITGLKIIELSSDGDADAIPLDPGAEIPASRSMVDQLTDRATAIADQLQTLLANLVDVTSGKNAQLATSTLQDLNLISGSIARLIAENEPAVASLSLRANDAVDETVLLLQDARKTLTVANQTLTGLGASADRAADWLNPNDVARLMRRVETSLAKLDAATVSADRALDTARARMGKAELGATLSAFTHLANRSEKLVARADTTLIQARDDLLRAMAVFVEGAEAFAELAALLKEDPSALIKGRGGKERSLP